jgi:hypothetical protein
VASEVVVTPFGGEAGISREGVAGRMSKVAAVQGERLTTPVGRRWRPGSYNIPLVRSNQS